MHKNSKLAKERGQRLKEAREKSGISLMQLRDMLRDHGQTVSLQTVYRWQRGAPIDASLWQLVCKILDIPMDS